MKVSLVTRYNGNPSFFALCQLGKDSQSFLNVVWLISVQDQYETNQYQYHTAYGPHYISFIRNYNSSISHQVYFISPDLYHNWAKVSQLGYWTIPVLSDQKHALIFWQKIQLMNYFDGKKIHIDLTTFRWDTHNYTRTF